MTVHVLIPVFNRIAMTRIMVEQLRQQDMDETLAITVIDDGSTDGTAEYLAQQKDLLALTGDGNLWWGGAIDLGLRHVLAEASDEDWVLFVNNDTEIRTDFIQRLLDAARRHAPAAVGSVVRDIEAPHQIFSIGPRINTWRFLVRDVEATEIGQDGTVLVDALSGRGVIYPVVALRAAGGMQPRWLPQYLADYEVSLRVAANGFCLLVASDAAVYSSDNFGSAYRPLSLRDRYFSIRSPTYLPAQLVFWWRASGLLGKISLPFRLVVHFLGRQVLRERTQERQ